MIRRTLFAIALAAIACAGPLGTASARAAEPDTLVFEPAWADTGEAGNEASQFHYFQEDRWLRAPFGDNLITDPDAWRSLEDESRSHLIFDYNRVDRLRLGFGYEVQRPGTLLPRVGARIEYPFDRKRVGYGLQIEQPLMPPGRLAVGASMVRTTDHSELQQVEDFENTLALLFGRQDYRDYFEREGFGAYLSWRVPDFSTVSVHLRNDKYRSLPLQTGTVSWFNRDRQLRANPPVDEGEMRSVSLRLERLAHRTYRTRAGLYHWIELQRAGGARLGGDFTFTRLLADVRSVLRLSPATTLSLRGVVGYTPDGTLPFQKHFTVGGVDGLRAHTFAQYRGDQMLLGQAEYTAGLWPIRTGMLEGGVQAIAFLDVGRAWFDPSHSWSVADQHLGVDGGLGLALSEDGLRVYLAKNLQDADSDVVISLRLQRPF